MLIRVSWERCLGWDCQADACDIRRAVSYKWEQEKMKTLTKYNPVTELDDLTSRINSFFGRPLIRPSGDGFFAEREWSLPVDVCEEDKEYVIKAELPEVKKEDVKVTIENGALKISGERKMVKEDNGVKYHRIERCYGAFERSFVIPEGAKADEVSAEFKDGLLKVHLPKGKEARPKSVEIEVK